MKSRGYRDTMPPNTQNLLDRLMTAFLELNTQPDMGRYGADAGIPDMLAFKVELEHMIRRAYESGQRDIRKAVHTEEYSNRYCPKRPTPQKS